MKPTGNQLLVGLIVLALVVWFVRQGGQMPGRGGNHFEMSEVEYQGQHFKLRKSYSDYEDFMEDPDALDPSEYARVEQAVTEAKVARSYRTHMQLVLVVFKLQFPGYGMRTFGTKLRGDVNGLVGFAIEVPHTDKYRLLVFRGHNGRYTLLDDFVTEFDLNITQLREEDGQLLYCTRDGKALITRSVINP